MATAIKWFSAAFGAAFGTGLAIVAGAAVGDAVYEVAIRKGITKTQAACYADCAIADGAWDGSRAGMESLRVGRSGSGFVVRVNGLKTAPLADVPNGAVLRGVAE